MRPWRRARAILPGLAALLALAGDAAAEETVAGDDPWMGFNRAVFRFNDTIDVFFFEPVAKGWAFLVPDPVEESLSNVFSNLGEPRVVMNDLLQGKGKQAGRDTARFLVNTTFGVLGFADVATGWGLEEHKEDFGQTLGVWGVPPGPYLVLPLLGPSSPREALGEAVDTVSSIYWYFVPIEPNLVVRGVGQVNSRAEMIDTVRRVKEASLDYYAAVRDAYRRYRQGYVEDRPGGSRATEDEDLYRIEE